MKLLARLFLAPMRPTNEKHHQNYSDNDRHEHQIEALFKNRGGRDGRGWILFAAIVMLVIYLIPHSLLGSELDYTKMPQSS